MRNRVRRVARINRTENLLEISQVNVNETKLKIKRVEKFICRTPNSLDFGPTLTSYATNRMGDG